MKEVNNWREFRGLACNDIQRVRAVFAYRLCVCIFQHDVISARRGSARKQLLLYVVIILELCILWQKTTSRLLFVTSPTKLCSRAYLHTFSILINDRLCLWSVLCLLQSVRCFSHYLIHQLVAIFNQKIVLPLYLPQTERDHSREEWRVMQLILNYNLRVFVFSQTLIVLDRNIRNLRRHPSHPTDDFNMASLLSVSHQQI